MPVFVADIHHVARVIIMILDAVLRDAGARQRIFGGEKGRREVIIALRDEHPQSRILAQRLSDIGRDVQIRSEEHTSELQSLMRISYAVFCLNKKKTTNIS